MPLTAGTRFGPYEIVCRVGIGGFGDVYKARDTRLDRTVAVKVLRAGAVDDPQARRRFQAEARTAATLNHPHVVSVYDVGEIDGSEYLVTEFVEGGTLRDWVSAEPRSTRDVLDLLSGIAEGLAAAHAAGILHRDIKPDNILVAPSGHAKLADFGLAKVVELYPAGQLATRTATHGAAVVGTIAYMSPETIAGRCVDARSDVFSLGVVLYELLCGRRPFTGESDIEVLHNIAEQAPPPLPAGIAEGILGIVEKALEKDPAERYQSARELAIDLRRLARPSMQQAASPDGTVTSRRRHTLVIAAIMLGLLGGAGAWYATRQRGHAAGIRSLAVLPLTNMSGDPQQEYFSDGTTEELIEHLAQIRALRVISRTSVMHYKGTAKAIPAIGRELGVDAILEGSVRRAGGRVRVTAQLIQASTDTHLWARDFDEDESDILRLESEVAQAIAREIEVQLSPDERSRLAGAKTVNVEAQNETMLGQYLSWQGGGTNRTQAIAHLRRAIQVDPHYAPAYARLASTLEDPPGDPAEARRLAEKALALDPMLAESHAALGSVLAGEWDWIGADREFRRAIELNPNSLDACGCYAFFLIAVGRATDAIAITDRMVASNPLSSASYDVSGNALLNAHRFDDAEVRLKRGIALDSASSRAILAELYGMEGRGADALRLVDRPEFANSPELARAYARVGDKAKAARVLADAVRGSDTVGYDIALAYFVLGQPDEAFKMLKRAVDERHALDPSPLTIYFDPYRDDPRFGAVVARLKFPH